MLVISRSTSAKQAEEVAFAAWMIFAQSVKRKRPLREGRGTTADSYLSRKDYKAKF